MKLMLVEDHALLAQSLAIALRSDGCEVVVAQSVERDDVVRCAEDTHPDLVFLDLCLGEDKTAIPLIEPLRSLGSRVVILTGETDPVRLAECIAAGAMGVVPKSSSFDDLVAVIRQTAMGECILNDARRREMLNELTSARAEEAARLASFKALTPREQFVLAQLMAGRTVDQIASTSVVSLTTVRTHVRSILAKLDVHSQIAAVAAAHAAGWSLTDSQLFVARSS